MLNALKRTLLAGGGPIPRSNLQTPLVGIRPSKTLNQPLRSRFPSLREVFPGTPPEDFSHPLEPPKTKVTILNNGLRVASEDSYSPMAAFGLYVQGGTRYEPLDKPCISYLLERLAFKSTSNRTASLLVQQCEYIGAHIVTGSDRENICYSVVALRDCLPEALDILADSVLNPLFTQEEIDEQLDAIEVEQEEMNNYDFTIPQLLHKVAYQGHPLGTSLKELYPTIRKNISRDELIEYKNKFYTGSRMVIAGASVNHDEFVDLASRYFDTLPPTDPGSIVEIPVKYKGGYICDVLPDKYMEEPGAKHYFAIAFECSGWIHEDCYTMAILGKILGGGTSFSAGGPGKGVFSRMYTNLMNVYGWIESAEALMACYVDTGLFGIYASCQPSNLPSLVEYVCQELGKLITDPIENPSTFVHELVRAQNQLKSSIFTNLEQRSILFDDIGRQVLIYGERFSAEEVCQRIDGVTIEDCVKVAKKILSSKPTIVVLGEPENKLPSYQIIELFFRSLQNKR